NHRPAGWGGSNSAAAGTGCQGPGGAGGAGGVQGVGVLGSGSGGGSVGAGRGTGPTGGLAGAGRGLPPRRGQRRRGAGGVAARTRVVPSRSAPNVPPSSGWNVATTRSRSVEGSFCQGSVTK